MQKSLWAPRAWLKVLPPLSSGSKGRVLFEDKLCHMHEFAYIPGGRINGLRTSKDISKLVQQSIQKHFYVMSSDVKILIINFDDDMNMPPEKAKEQEKRSKAKNPYPANVEFVDEGIVVQLPLSGVKETVPQIELVDLSRVMDSRPVRPKLWDYVRKDMQKIQYPSHATIILNYNKSGPWLWTKGKPAVHMTQWAHDLKESDTAPCEIWYKLFHEYDFINDSVDTDRIAIDSSYLMSCDEKFMPKSILWRYKDKAEQAHQLVDMKILMEDTLKYTGLSAAQFIRACILCKSDFYDKSLISNQMGPATIFNAVAASKDYIKEWNQQDLELFTRLLLTLTFVDHKKTPPIMKILVDHKTGLKRKRQEEEEEENKDAMEEDDVIDLTSYTDNSSSKRMKLEGGNKQINKTIFITPQNASAILDEKFRLGEETMITSASRIWTEKYIKSFLSQNEIKKYKYPSKEAIETAFKQLEFNSAYWMRDYYSQKQKLVGLDSLTTPVDSSAQIG